MFLDGWLYTFLIILRAFSLLAHSFAFSRPNVKEAFENKHSAALNTHAKGNILIMLPTTK